MFLEQRVGVTIQDLASEGAERALLIRDDRLGLHAYLVLDDLRLGPAAGGVRTWRYASPEDALTDARALARAMTLKCAIGGLRAGGGKAVVLAKPGLKRREAFRTLGEVFEGLQGAFRTAGDVGTSRDDLLAMSETCSWVHAEESSLARSVARGVSAALRGALTTRGSSSLQGRSALVQGAGSIGSEVVRELTRAGAAVSVADLDTDRARAIAEATGAVVRPVSALWDEPGELVLPCALGGVIDDGFLARTQASVVCGGANNVLANPDVERALLRAGVTFVPDFLSSAGGVIDGIGETVMGLADRGPLIDAIAETTEQVLREAERTRATATEVATRVAERRLAGT